MVYLSPEVKKLTEFARLSDVEAIRDRFRHQLRQVDLRWLDELITRRRFEDHVRPIKELPANVAAEIAKGSPNAVAVS